MSSELRGSDKLKMKCDGCNTLSDEQLENVMGGLLGSVYYVFPKGIPWPEPYSQIGHTVANPVQTIGQTGLIAR